MTTVAKETIDSVKLSYFPSHNLVTIIFIAILMTLMAFPVFKFLKFYGNMTWMISRKPKIGQSK